LTATAFDQDRNWPAPPILYSITFWCEDHRLKLEDIEPIAISAYIEELGAKIARPSVKQHLAAIRQLFDYLVMGGILLSNPAG
jgi:site-specific recombinase XerD